MHDEEIRQGHWQEPHFIGSMRQCGRLSHLERRADLLRALRPPSSPAIVMAKKILDTGPPRTGAFPCMGFFSLEEIVTHLTFQGIWTVRGDATGWSPRLK